MRMRSCFLYTASFLLVGSVCLVVAVATVASSGRNAAVARLEDEIVDRGALMNSGPPVASGPEEQAKEGAASSSVDVQTAGADLARLAEDLKTLESQPGWQAALELYQGEASPGEWSDAQWAEVADLVAVNADLLDRARAITTSSGHSLEPLTAGNELKPGLPAAFVATAKLLAMDTLVAGHGGDAARVAANVQASSAWAGALMEGRNSLCLAMGYSFTESQHAALRDAVPPGVFDAGQTHAMTEALAHAFELDACVASMRGEAAAGRTLFEQIRANDPEAILPMYGSLFLRPLLNLDEQAYAEAMLTLIDASARPWYAVRDEVRALEEELDGPFKPVTRILTVTAPFLRNAEAWATVDLMRLGLLLELEYAETGRYPETLDVVAADLGGSVPLDPFTGEPYRYLPQGDTFQLYSLYVNATDDGGAWQGRDGDFAWRGGR